MKEGDNMQAALKESTATEEDWRERYYEESNRRTKDDIKELKQETKELKQDVKELRQDIQNIKDDIRALDSKIDQIDLKTQMSIFELKQEVKQEISSLRNEMHEKFDGLLWKILLGISAILGAFLGLTKYFAG